MEKVKLTETEIKQGVYQIKPYTLRFTNDEKKSFRMALKKYNPKSVEGFINHLELICRIRKKILKSEQISDLRDKKKDMLKSFKRTLDFLKHLKRRKSFLPFPERMREADQERLLDVYIFGLKAPDIAHQAAGPLEQLIKMIEDSPTTKKRARGHPPADYTGFVTKISDIFSLNFQESPTTYTSGPFAEVVRITLESMDVPGNIDPSRAIKYALKRTSY